MSTTAITVEGVGKAYRIGMQADVHRTLRESLVGLARAPFERFRRLSEAEMEGEDTFWALRDVSFEVGRGEVVGIIGRNGAGKSTLLKVLSRITEPTEGIARLKGRVASLLEVGTGFHPELSGRENIYLNGAILGMRKGEIDRKFDQIVDFSGVERFLDTPVKRYSSGMYVRLAFAVAAHLEPEILIVDEVLAVGDAEFQKKCLGKMQEVATGQGRTVLFVSHNMPAVQTLCGRGVYLKGGQVAAIGPVQEVIGRYLGDARQVENVPLRDRTDREGSGEMRVVGLTARNMDPDCPTTIYCGAGVRFDVDYEMTRPPRSPWVHLSVFDMMGTRIFVLSTKQKGNGLTELQRNGRVSCIVPRLPLPSGRYRVNVAIGSDSGYVDRVEAAMEMEVHSVDYHGGGDMSADEYVKCLVDHTWSEAG